MKKITVLRVLVLVLVLVNVLHNLHSNFFIVIATQVFVSRFLFKIESLVMNVITHFVISDEEQEMEKLKNGEKREIILFNGEQEIE